MRYYFFPRAYAAALALIKHYWQRSETASILRGQNLFVDALSINKMFVYALPRTIRNVDVVNERGMVRGGFSFTTSTFPSAAFPRLFLRHLSFLGTSLAPYAFFIDLTQLTATALHRGTS